MNIAIDGYEANVSQRVGSSQVAFELLKAFEKIDQRNSYTILLPSAPLTDLPKERAGWEYKILRPKKFWTRIALPLYLYTTKFKPDLFFSPTHYIPMFSPVKRIATIFDLSFLHFPEMFERGDLWKLKNWTKFSVENAAYIITISNSTKRDMINQYNIDRKKITVAYPGYDKNIFPPAGRNLKIQKLLGKYKIKGNYIIYVGTIQPRKNLVRLIEAVSRIEDLKLIIVGKTRGEGRQGWMYQEILNTPKNFGIEDRVKFLGFVEVTDLSYLLSGAQAFVLPSLYEGFGITVLEAMACGTPVIVSSVSSLPEVVGKAGLLVDPYSVDQIEMAIRTVISDKKIRMEKSKEGLEQVKKFSWDRMARIILKTFASLKYSKYN